MFDKNYRIHRALIDQPPLAIHTQYTAFVCPCIVKLENVSHERSKPRPLEGSLNCMYGTTH